ncbi:DUF5605 domain-containing protein [Pengzhenrongella sp.]|jgi:hypothetical protein|uniref:DUF5605 domain-containing protein n=1 Tax=Pengzhenrongella sp. TaxID=2888820 RepID=UPI002F939E32
MFDRRSTVAEALRSPAARTLLDRHLPGVVSSPAVAQLGSMRLGQLTQMVPATREDPALADLLWAELAALADGHDAAPVYGRAIEPDPGYEPATVARGSATVELPAVELPAVVGRWGVLEVTFHGPSHGNPFVDVELTAIFSQGERTLTAGGFYDGDGLYRVRVLAEREGRWEFETSSTARSLDGIRGAVEVGPPAPGNHGPVRVDGLHFRYADGTRHRPIGTTCYAWTHQGEALERATLETLRSAGFTKMRMCVFPKSYLFNENEPELYPFEGSLESGWDVERFDPAFFRHLEERITDLADLGIEADLILFHAYDRWGFADLGPAVDDRYVRYLVRRLAALRTVWWSMANEYDLLWAKTTVDWERLAAVVGENDPHGHLNSIHNCFSFYDYAKPWITHASMQRIDPYRTAENTNAWREQWGKPVVIDECAYEGDIDQGWGNITGEEMVRRSWEGAIRGGYVGHGETYLNDREELWWSKGGELVGTSPARIAFLDRILADSPTGVIDPLPSEWDVPWGGVAGRYVLGYFGFNQPRYRDLVLPDGDFHIDVIDTWRMTIDRLDGVHRGTVRVDLPGRQYMAVRLVRAAD